MSRHYIDVKSNLSKNIMQKNAMDMPEFNLPGVSQNLECVIVVVGCDGTGSVGSNGDTIIGSINENNK